MKYQKKQVVVEASQWFKKGDHPEVSAWHLETQRVCECGKPLSVHGVLPIVVGGCNVAGPTVCPGDWIVKKPNGTHIAVKPDVFAHIYEPVPEDE